MKKFAQSQLRQDDKTMWQTCGGGGGGEDGELSIRLRGAQQQQEIRVGGVAVAFAEPP